MIALENVHKDYHSHGNNVAGLKNVNIQVAGGQFVCIKGPSGSGKTTLLLTIGGMQHPTSGQVRVAGEDLYAMSSSDRARFRAKNVGFVFQLFHLVPYLNVLDNVRLGACGQWGSRSEALDLLLRLGLEPRVRHKPAELSVGECQRAAIARAMLGSPGLILADEPTGNLDDENARVVLNILAEYCREGGTVLCVTHGPQAQEYADRVLHIDAGTVEEQTAAAE